MAPVTFIDHKNTTISMPTNNPQSFPNNYDQKSDMHNILLGVLAIATTVTAVWWQGRDNRRRRNARVSTNELIIELDDLPANQADGINVALQWLTDQQQRPMQVTLERQIRQSMMLVLVVTKVIQHRTRLCNRLLTLPVDISSLNQLATPANNTQDAHEHSTINNGQIEGAVDNPTVVHAVEGVLQETETHEI
ncbi:hypothetical protein LTR97_010675 [Elasticomyces elasticus]|uniref:Uncharacterized protein n=1 Tax=Elasticomyces elasticus TaxID=574655 RepID=A0AAN7VZQ8_9PEZI|nr:hypothetical protein LTR97_010675 [Elasticomyces elasticus]